MREKRKKVEEKFDFISAELCKSEVVSDMELYKKYMQELKHLSPIVEKYREYKAAENNAEEAKGLLEESVELRVLISHRIDGADATVLRHELAVVEIEEGFRIGIVGHPAETEERCLAFVDGLQMLCEFDLPKTDADVQVLLEHCDKTG